MERCAAKSQHKQCVRREGQEATPISAASGEKDPAEYLVAVARRYRGETLAGCGETIQVEQSSDGLHVWDSGAGQARRAGRVDLVQSGLFGLSGLSGSTK